MLTKELITQLEQASLADALHSIARIFPYEVVFSSSFGQEDQVITDTIYKNDLPVKVFTLDTGRLFGETYELIDKTIARYQKPLHIYFPDANDVEKFVTEKGMNSLYESVANRKECCEIRKDEFPLLEVNIQPQ